MILEIFFCFNYFFRLCKYDGILCTFRMTLLFFSKLFGVSLEKNIMINLMFLLKFSLIVVDEGWLD